jgi:hypothetical protein
MQNSDFDCVIGGRCRTGSDAKDKGRNNCG